ncbi:hypothetical protein LWI29_013556 [Acer saccharum]|uniref:Protein kinase domain-containing protein n=1 Tax=Acer saccharum TaxID=4024 RepID=A0AA39VMG7_ACESA|nr:hypothetical protein LWI29_013556 [Acer saccharum]
MPIFACLILRINVISLPLPSGYLGSLDAKTGVSYSGILPDGSRVGIMRMKIATTLAQGIAFLHDKVKQPHVHQDIHADNVLLDEEFGAHLMGVSVKVCAMGSDAGEDSNGRMIRNMRYIKLLSLYDKAKRAVLPYLGVDIGKRRSSICVGYPSSGVIIPMRLPMDGLIYTIRHNLLDNAAGSIEFSTALNTLAQ